MEFGTNTGRQGTYDPRDARQRSMAMSRLRELEDEYGDRLEIGFTGETGLAKNDAHGWSRMLNAQTEAKNIRRIAEGKGPVNIQYGGTMQTRTLPPSMQSLGMYDDDVRRRGEHAYAEASKAGWVPDEVRVAGARQRNATTDYLENRARQSGTIANEMRDDADPMARRYEALADTETTDRAFNESYGRRRGTGALMAADKTQDMIGSKTAEMDLALTHPLAKMERERASKDARMRASMEALGRVFTQPENFELAGGMEGLSTATRGILGDTPEPTAGVAPRTAPGETAGVPAGQLNIQVPGVPDEIAAELQSELTRRGLPVTLKNIQTVYTRLMGAQPQQ